MASCAAGAICSTHVIVGASSDLLTTISDPNLEGARSSDRLAKYGSIPPAPLQLLARLRSYAGRAQLSLSLFARQ